MIKTTNSPTFIHIKFGAKTKLENVLIFRKFSDFEFLINIYLYTYQILMNEDTFLFLL